ncbi:hypothetical protein, unknown function [Leishmania tarentolae]|uniref:Uncharacterized protein n=1 Tax=Leishmania tarentolae TaxID=5689 RepID=A0A640K8R1_LEITA|nr:hypothetical protein, unknown function [Leishmania tarentolae]
MPFFSLQRPSPSSPSDACGGRNSGAGCREKAEAPVERDVSTETVTTSCDSGSVKSSNHISRTAVTPPHSHGTKSSGAQLSLQSSSALSTAGLSDMVSLQAPAPGSERFDHLQQEQRQLVPQPQPQRHISTPLFLEMCNTTLPTSVAVSTSSTSAASVSMLPQAIADRPALTTAATETTADGFVWPLRGPPYEGVYLQPSTFRLGATHGDILWALYQSNGIVAEYIDSRTPAFPPVSRPANAVASQPATTRRFNAATCKVPAARGSRGNSHEDAASETHKVRRVITTATEQRSPFAAAATEIALCLSGAGSSTPSLVSFDYVITPAQLCTTSGRETAATMHADALTSPLAATAGSRIQEVVQGTSPYAKSYKTGIHSTMSALPPATGTTAATRGGGLPLKIEARTPAALSGSLAEERWQGSLHSTEDSPNDAASAFAVSEAEVQRRLHACAALVQRSLSAARRVGDMRKLRFYEPVPSSSGIPTAQGSIACALCGGTTGEGAQMATSSLWSGVQVALASMLVNEKASFIIGPADATMFSMPLDGTAYVRFATAAAAAVAEGKDLTSCVVTAPHRGAHKGFFPLPSYSRQRVRAFSELSVETRPHQLSGNKDCRGYHSISDASGCHCHSCRTHDSSDVLTAHASSPVTELQSSLAAAAASSRASPSDAPIERGSRVSMSIRKWRLWHVRAWGRRGSRADASSKRAVRKPISPSLPSSTPSAPPLKGNMMKTYPTGVRHHICSKRSSGVRLPSPNTLGNATTAAPTGQPVQSLQLRVQTPTSTLPGDDLAAYKIALHGGTEPVLVHLRLRERIPMLPLCSSRAQAPLLVSAEPLDAPMPPRLPGEAAPDAANSVGAVTAPSLGDGVAPRTSACPQKCCLSTGALLCLARTNAMLKGLVTPLHRLPRPHFIPDPAVAAKACPTRAHVTATTTPSPAACLSLSLAELMRGQLCRQRILSAGRAALCTALVLTMEAKVLGAQDRARCLPGHLPAAAGAAGGAVVVTGGSGLRQRQPRCPATSEASPNESEGRDGNTDDGDGDGSVADTVLTTPSSTMITETADASSGSATTVGGTTSTRYLWMPPLPLQDLVQQFIAHLHDYGLTEDARRATVDAVTMTSAAADAAKDDADSRNSELSRVLDTFTQYAHQMASVEFSVDVFDPIQDVYVPYVHPLRAAMARAPEVSDAGETASRRHAQGLSIMRGCIGCVLYPCWLDLALQARRHRCGSDIHVVTQGYPAEAEERLFMCSIFNNAADEALSASHQLQRAMTTYSEGEAAAPAHEDEAPSTGAADCPCATSSTATNASASVEASAPVAAAPFSASKRCTGRSCRGSETYDNTDRAELLSRRRLSRTAQSRNGCHSLQRYRLHLHACEPLLSPRQFFAVSRREGLAAARALLADASALLQYYYEVLDTLSATTSPARMSSPLSASSPSLGDFSELRLRAAVPSVLRRGASFEVRGQRSRQRLPYLLFGEEPAPLMAAAAARAQAMGARCTMSCGTNCDSESAERTSSAPSLVTSLNERTAIAETAAAQSCGVLQDGSDVSWGAAATPPIELLAAALMLAAPSAAGRATTLAARVPLALDRILLKALPKLHLAILVLTLGVREDEVVPTTLLQRVYGAWWTRAAATPVQGVSSAAAAAAAEAAAASTTAASITVSAASKGLGFRTLRRTRVSAAAGACDAVEEEDMRLFYHRYVYLGECFSSLAYLCAELPGLRLMGREACTMALFYLPRNAPLWALWGTLAYQLGNSSEARDNMRVAIALTTLEESAERGLATKAGHDSPLLLAPASSPAADVSCTLGDTVSELLHGGRAHLLQYARAFLD